MCVVVQVMAKDLFKAVKEKYGEKLNSLISTKIIVVAGDITYENLCIKDNNLLNQIHNEVDVVVNLAATTNFDERYVPPCFIFVPEKKMKRDTDYYCNNFINNCL